MEGLSLPLTEPVFLFTLLLACALFTQLTVERLRLPGLLGLILAGMLLGPGGTGVLPREPVVELLGMVGLVYVMFLAGVEIDLERARERTREVVSFGLLAFSISFLAGAAGGHLFGFEPTASILLGALIASHTLVGYPILVRYGLLDRIPVVSVIGGTVITDTLALVVLAVVLSAQGAGGLGAAAALPLVLLALVVALSLWWIPRVTTRLLARSWMTPAEKALYVLVVVLSLSALAELIGTDKILGAFLAGISLNRPLGRRDPLRSHVEFVGRMLFIPFFFLWTGMLLELDVFTGRSEVWILATALIVAVVAAKLVGSWLNGAIFGYPHRDRLLMAGLTMPQAAATLAVTVSARQAGILEPSVVDAVILLIFFTCLAGPLLTNQLARRLGTGR